MIFYHDTGFKWTDREGNATFKAVPLFSTQAYYTAARIPPNFTPSKARRRGTLMHSTRHWKPSIFCKWLALFYSFSYYNSYLNLHRGEWRTGRGPFCTHRGLSVSRSPPARRWTASELLPPGSSSSCVGWRAATGKQGTLSAAERRLEWPPSHSTLHKKHIISWGVWPFSSAMTERTGLC